MYISPARGPVDSILNPLMEAENIKILEELPFEERKKYLRNHYETNNWPLDRYHTRLESVNTISEAAHRDGVVPVGHTFPVMGVFVDYYFRDAPGGPRVHSFNAPVKDLSDLSVESLNDVIFAFEQLSPTPEVYFLYRFVKHHVSQRPQE